MFKNIGTFFEKKKNLVSKNQDKTTTIKTNFYLFLKNKLGKEVLNFNFDLNYSSKENSLTIITNNKTMANELSLYLDQLNSFFKEKEIKLNQILVR